MIVGVGTLVDGNPDNNFLSEKDVVRFNPDGKLTGAMQAYVAGRWLYVVGRNGLFVVDIDKPGAPKSAGELVGARSTASLNSSADGVSEIANAAEHKSVTDAVERVPTALTLKNPRAIAVQWRYAFVTDDDGLKVVDITEPTRPALVPNAFVPLAHAGRLYVARTYAYVANGPEGLAIIDIEKPKEPKLDQMFNADGTLNDTRAVQIGAVNASMFALVADGKNGLRVLQLISPDTVPGHMGFSPRPNPKLIATFPTEAPAVAVSRGLDRDRVVDETGNQTVVFGRRGSRPFNLREMTAFYRHFDGAPPNDLKTPRTGSVYQVEDIVTRDGALLLHSGEKISNPRQFQPLSESISSSPRLPADRLIRRGK